MSNSKEYKGQEPIRQVVNEPVAEYGVAGDYVETYLNAIPMQTMQALIDTAIDDFETGCCTAHSQMGTWVKDRMGWKWYGRKRMLKQIVSHFVLGH